jgi:hypothetical protein
MNARCKFQVTSVTSFAHGAFDVVLDARYDKPLSEEDRAFSVSTPSGKLTATINNYALKDTFKPGAYFYLDLIPAEAA